MFSILVGILLLLMFAFSMYVSAHKQKIISAVEKAIKDNLNGNVSIGSIDISVWRSFPKAEIDLNNVSMVDSFRKPLLQVEQISATAGLFDLIGSKINISRVTLTNGVIDLFTDSTGYTNSYLLKKKQKPGNTKGKKVSIKNIVLNNVSFITENKQTNKKFEVVFEKMNASIKERSDSGWQIRMREKCLVKGLGFDLAKGSFVNNQTIEGRWNIFLNIKAPSFSFDKTTVIFNGQPFTLDGAFDLKEPSHFELHVSSNNLQYAQAIQLLPYNIDRRLTLFKLSRPLNVIAAIQGPMAKGTTPLVNVAWSVKGTDLKTDIVSFSNCAFSGAFTNQIKKELPVSDENSEVSFSGFSGYLGAIKLTGKEILVTNLLDAQLHFDFSSNCTFAQLDSTLELNSIRFVSGFGKLHLLYDGPLVNDMTILNQLNIALDLHNGIIDYTPRNFIFNNFNGAILFANNTLKSGNFHCDLKQDHFDVNITGNDISKLSDSIAGKATIYCSVFTPSCDLADLKSFFSTKTNAVRKKATSKSIAGATSEIDDILENGNFFVNIKADKLFLDKFEATNANAKLIFTQTEWRIVSAALQQGGGSLNISANISNKDPAYHQATASLTIQNADVQKVFNAFDNFGQDGLTYKNLRGMVNINAALACGFDNKGAIVDNSISGNVFFSLKNGALLDYKPLEQIKVSFLKSRDLNDIEFAELHDSINIHNKDIYFHRMEIASSVVDLFVEGVFSLADNTDISIQVPFSNLKKQPQDRTLNPKGTQGKAGPSLYFRARPDKTGHIKIKLDIFRKLRGDGFDKLKTN